MIWPDIVLTIANLIFTYALFPQVYQGFKTRKGAIVLQTGILTSLGLFASCIAFFSLGLIFSGTICNINAILWVILTIQRLIFKK
tara:strand:- start:568 stop:822 length:255 start_codon:yes stop_codon:yes gene_type:complete